MPKHGTASALEASEGVRGEFLGAGTKALYFVSGELDAPTLDRWARSSEEFQRIIRLGLGPVITTAPTSEQAAVGIVKTVAIQIGGDRTTDQMVEAARKDRTYINLNITQEHMPAGFGPLRSVTLEFRQFDHDPHTEEVTDWQNQPGHGPSGYEDGLRYREARPEDQQERPHIFVPEAPWCDADGIPWALSLWSDADDRRVDLNGCGPRNQCGIRTACSLAAST